MSKEHKIFLTNFNGKDSHAIISQEENGKWNVDLSSMTIYDDEEWNKKIHVIELVVGNMLTNCGRYIMNDRDIVNVVLSTIDDFQ